MAGTEQLVHNQQLLDAGIVPTVAQHAAVFNTQHRQANAIQTAPATNPAAVFARRHPVILTCAIVLLVAGIAVAVWAGLASGQRPPCGNGEVRMPNGNCAVCGSGTYCGNGVCSDQSAGGVCTDCRTDGDCADGSCVQTPAGTYQCVPGCSTDADCASAGAATGRTVCDTTSSTCVACTSAAQCSGAPGQAQPSCVGGMCVYCGVEGLSCDKGFSCLQNSFTCHAGCRPGDNDTCPSNTTCVTDTASGPDGGTVSVCAPCQPSATSAKSALCPSSKPYCHRMTTPHGAGGPALRCVECINSAGCHSGFTCDVATNTCVPPGPSGTLAASLRPTTSHLQGRFLVYGTLHKSPPSSPLDGGDSLFGSFSVPAVGSTVFLLPPAGGAADGSRLVTESMSGGNMTFLLLPTTSHDLTSFALAAYQPPTAPGGSPTLAVLARSCVNPSKVGVPLGKNEPLSDVLTTASGSSACAAPFVPLTSAYQRGGTAATTTDNYYTVNGFLATAWDWHSVASIPSMYGIFEAVKADGSVVKVSGSGSCGDDGTVCLPPVIAFPTHGTVCHIAMKPPAGGSPSDTLYMGCTPDGLAWVTPDNLHDAVALHLTPPIS